MWLRNRALSEMPHVRIMNLEQYDGVTTGELYIFITLSFDEDAERQKLQYSFMSSCPIKSKLCVVLHIPVN